MGSQDTEITLGTGKMLALFFGLVALCGIFFGVGYTMGRAGTHLPLLGTEPAQTQPGSGVQPAATTKTPAPTTQTGDLTFYKAVEQKDANAQLPASSPPAANPPAPVATASAPAAANASAPPTQDPKPASSDAPDPMTVNATAYYVQVAAVTKSDDAQALVEALKKKQYSAFSTNNSATDRLFHVQIGPFTDVKDAEATKAKLISDGYNPILKK